MEQKRCSTVRALGAFIVLGVVLSPTERFPEPTQQLTTIQGIQPPLISENRHTSVILTWDYIHRYSQNTHTHKINSRIATHLQVDPRKANLRT